MSTTIEAYAALAYHAWGCTRESQNHAWLYVRVMDIELSHELWHNSSSPGYFTTRWRTCPTCGVLERQLTASELWQRHGQWWIEQFLTAVARSWVIREDTQTILTTWHARRSF